MSLNTPTPLSTAASDVPSIPSPSKVDFLPSPNSIYSWASKDGSFKRQVSTFRSMVEKGKKFPPAVGRYRLYVSLACPWAHRTLILLGLQHVIDTVCVDYVLGENGWAFSTPDKIPECQPEPQYGVPFLRDLYFKAASNYMGRFTVPVLWDTVGETIVNNESSEIIRILNSAFNDFATNPTLDLYPEAFQKEIDSVNDWVYSQLNNGVYKTGFATIQKVYEENVVVVFEALDRIEKMLSDGRRWFLSNDTITEADVRLFTTVLRFDPVYHGHFKCNLKRISDYPFLLQWLKRFYAIDGIKETCNMDHIKRHYYMSHKQINPNRIYPLSDGPKLD